MLGRALEVSIERGLPIGDAPDLLARLGVGGPATEESGGRFSVRLRLVRSPAALPARAVAPVAPARTRDAVLPVRCADGALWEVGDDAAGAQLGLDAPGGATVVAWDATGCWAALEPAAALRLMVAEALRAGGLVQLHAAVVAREGGAVALLGPSGAGKSTTVLRAAREGWAPICEDLAWVDPASLAVACGDRGVRMWPEARDRYAPWLADLAWAPEPDGKVLLPYDTLRGGGAAHARLVGLALLCRPETSARSCADGDAPAARDTARALWEAAGLPLVAAHQRSLGDAVARLARTLRARWLPLGALPDLPSDAPPAAGAEKHERALGGTEGA